MMVGLMVPGIKEGTFLYAVTVHGGTVTGTIGLVDWINAKLERLENHRIKAVIEEGDLFIQCSHYTGTTQNVWDAWGNAPYVNKFQLGNRGIIVPMSVDEVRDFCGWER